MYINVKPYLLYMLIFSLIFFNMSRRERNLFYVHIYTSQQQSFIPNQLQHMDTFVGAEQKVFCDLINTTLYFSIHNFILGLLQNTFLCNSYLWWSSNFLVLEFQLIKVEIIFNNNMFGTSLTS